MSFLTFVTHGSNAMLRRFLSCSLREAGGVLSDIQGQTYYNVELVNVSTSEINFTGYRVRTSQTSVLHILSPTIARPFYDFFSIFYFCITLETWVG